jgi:radical SAM/Cys-rich protein
VQVDKHRLNEPRNKKKKEEEKNEKENGAAERWRRRDLFGTTLVDQTLQEIEQNGAAAVEVPTLTGEERLRRRRALDALGIPSFSRFLKDKLGDGEFQLKRKDPVVLQINVGLYCNQACAHCHVESSPLRTEERMTAETAAQCLELLKNTPSVTTLDLTGGAPELNPAFRYLVATARALRPDLEIIDRCNLTVLQEPGQEDLISFLKEHNVRVVASLPCYSADNVNKQRGNGVFDRSIAALLALNEAGYGVVGAKSEEPAGNGEQEGWSALRLDLVYNPLGAFLPPEQGKLRDQYKEQLADNFGIAFDDLFTITNMPIKRFADFLYRRVELQEYMQLLVRNFNADTVENLMCLDTVSIGYDGRIFDCDFNQQLDMDLRNRRTKTGLTVFDLNSLSELLEYGIRTDNHCFGCTAGMGSS